MGHNHKAFTSKDRKRDRDRRNFFKKIGKDRDEEHSKKRGGKGKMKTLEQA